MKFELGEVWEAPTGRGCRLWRVADWTGYLDGGRRMELENCETRRRVRRWDYETDGWKRQAVATEAA